MISLQSLDAQLSNRRDVHYNQIIGNHDNLVVIAGPGTGKTHLLALKAGELLQITQKSSQGIACLTFSRRLARRLEKFIYALSITLSTSNIFIGTIHSFLIAEVLQPYGELFHSKIFQQPNGKRYLRIASESMCKIAKSRVIRGTVSSDSFDKYRGTTYLNQKLKISSDTSEVDEEHEKAIVCYERNLYDHPNGRFLDFDMIVRAALQIVMSESIVQEDLASKFPYMLIDEYQDLGYPIHLLISKIHMRGMTKLFVVGDPNQCIHEFAGANRQYLDHLESVLPTIRLYDNYRHSHSVLSVLNCFDKGTQIRTRSEIGFSACVLGNYSNEKLEVAHKILDWLIFEYGAMPSDIAILCWRRDTATKLANMIHNHKVRLLASSQYRHHTRFMEWIEKVAIWSVAEASQIDITFEDISSDWLNFCSIGDLRLDNDQMLENKSVLFAVLSDLRAKNMSLLEFVRYLETHLNLKPLIDRLKEFSPDDAEEYLGFVENINKFEGLAKLPLEKFGTESSRTNEVRVNTIHGCKGLEAKFTIVVELDEYQGSDNLNLAYVACSRAMLGAFYLLSKQNYKVAEIHSRLSASVPSVCTIKSELLTDLLVSLKNRQ